MNHLSRSDRMHFPDQSASFGEISELPTAVQKSVSVPSARAGRPKKRKRTRRLIIFSLCIGLVLLPLCISGIALYVKYTSQYRRDLALAHDGVQRLQAAEQLLKGFIKGSFDVTTITQAKQDFSTSLADFTQLKNDLEQVPGIAHSVPKYGGLLTSALRIVPLAVELSQAGIIGSNALLLILPDLRGILNSQGRGITSQDLATVSQDLNQVQALLNTATTRVNQLQPADLQIDPRIGPALKTFRTSLPQLQTGLQALQTLVAVAPALLGINQPVSYLLEQLDSTELRPGGGFIGSYGLATFSGGHLASLKMTDTYLLDKPYEFAGHTIPFPQADSWFPLASTWSLRDSNLEADFPTNARYAEQIYRTEGGTGSPQGVIGITPWFIENALKITGPIYVSEYNQTVNAQNLVDIIHYHQLKEELAAGDNPSPDGRSSGRKRFTELLFEHFFTRVRQIAPTAMPKFVSLLLNSLRNKDVQVYLNSSSAEALLQQYHYASAIQAPAGDSLFVVDANIIANKANYFMKYVMRDQITIDAAGNAIHTTTLTYNWPYSLASQQNNYGGIKDRYTDYVRIYAPPGSVLQSQQGWTPQGPGQAFGREVWAGIFKLAFGQSGTITLTWMVRNAAIHDTHGWHYRYLLQRQAGITWNLNMQVTLPACARVTGYSGNLILNKNGALVQPLTLDSQLGIDYTCS